MTMMHDRGVRSLGFVAVVAVVAAGVFLLAPVKASYIERAESDIIDYRTASCGAPVLAMFDAEPGLGGGSQFPIGAVNAKQACKSAAGSRVAIGLVMLLLVSLTLTLWIASRRTNRFADAKEEPAAVNT
jgi:hypothetical protein